MTIREHIPVWVGGKRRMSASEATQPQFWVPPDYVIPSNYGALERIRQMIQRASSTHSELATRWADETAEDLVPRVLGALDKSKDEINELKKEVQKERKERMQAKEWADTKDQILEREKASNRQNLNNLKADHNRELENIKSQCQREVGNLKFNHQREVGGLKSNHQSQVANLKGSHQRELENLKIQYRTQLESVQNASNRQLTEHKAHVDDLNRNFSRREHALLESHEKDMVDVRQQNEDLKQALSAREHIKGLSDRELASQFKKLSTDIEDFSRIEWDPDREANWPCSEEQLKHLYPRNVRKLKQYIIQNCLWLTLYEYVFRTPFRIIGEYGEAFDARLYEANSPAYDVLEEDEKQDYNMRRYENAKVFLAALDSSDPSMVNLHAIMKSYHHARGQIVNLISHKMAKVMTLEDSEQVALDNILQSAARLWLDACSQRFRLFVILPDQSQDVLRLQRGNMNYLRLIIKPELWRFGNSRGDEMSKGELLAGWKSHTETFPLAH